jgi:hypothetical protein
MMFYGICGIFLCSVPLIIPSQVQKLQEDMPLGASVDRRIIKMELRKECFKIGIQEEMTDWLKIGCFGELTHSVTD